MRTTQRTPRVHGGMQLLSTVACWFLAACAGADVPTTSSPAQAEFLGSSGRPSPVRSLRLEYRDLARRAPDFAGVFFDSTGHLTINFASANVDTLAVREVMTWLERYRGPGPDLSTPRLRRVDFAYSTLDQYYGPLLGAIASMPFLTSSRIDDVRAQIVITISTTEEEPTIRGAAGALGIPQAALHVEHAPPARSDATLDDRVRPVYGGLRIAKPGGGECSLGFNGYHAVGGQPDPSQPPVFMTAGHCAGPGAQWGQNTYSVANHIGTTIHEAPVFFPPACPYSQGCQDADVLVVEYASGVSQGYGVVYKTNLGSLTITGTQGVSGDVYGALTGETVRKVGQTTGTTSGTITATCVDVPPRPEPGGTTPGTLCAQAANYGSGSGDSGGPVFIPYNPSNPYSTPRTVGIHFAQQGSTRYFSPMSQIWAAQDGLFYW